MSPLRRHSILLTALAILALQRATIRAGDGQTSTETSYRYAAEVAFPLAQQGVAAGVVMCDLPPALPGEPLDDRVRHAGTPALAICTALNASLVQRTEGGVLHVRTSNEPGHMTKLLNRSIDLEAASDVPAAEAVLTSIVNAVRGDRSAVKRGATGPASQPVTLRGGRTTFIQALDDVVRQAPGLVWYVTFLPEQEGGYEIGLIWRGGGTGGPVLQRPRNAAD